MGSRKKVFSPRFRIGKVSAYLHHGAWWIYYRDGGQPIRRKISTKRAQLPAVLLAQVQYFRGNGR